jgi:hypothetical protein
MPETLEQLFGAKEETNGEAALAVLTAHARRYLERREAADAARAELRRCEGERDAAETDLLRVLGEAKVKSLKLEGGPRLTSATRYVFALPPKCQPEERQEALRWLHRLNGGSDIIEREVHHSRLGAFLRERFAKGLPIHPLITTKELLCVQVRVD